MLHESDGGSFQQTDPERVNPTAKKKNQEIVLKITWGWGWGMDGMGRSIIAVSM